MRKTNLLLLAFLLSLSLSAQEWTQIEDYPGLGRNHPITFSIGDYGYVLAGQNEYDMFVKDFYRYDAVNNTWEQLPNFPDSRGVRMFTTDGVGTVETH